MKIRTRTLTTIATAMIGMALAGAAPAQNVGEAASQNTARPDMSDYNDAMKAVKSSYSAAAATCRAMGPGADQRNCMADAKATRKVDTAKAKQMRTSAVTSESRRGGAAAISGTPIAPSN